MTFKRRRRLNYSAKTIKIETYFFNQIFHSLMLNGSKLKYIKIFISFLLLLKNNYKIKNNKEMLNYFYIIYLRLKVRVYLKTKVIGKSKKLIPNLIFRRKQVFFVVSMILTSIKERKERTLPLKLFAEFKEILLRKITSKNSLNSKKRLLLEIRKGRWRLRYLHYLLLKKYK